MARKTEAQTEPVAVVCERISLGAGEDARIVRVGDYAVSCDPGCRLCFRNCEDGEVFTLSVDAVRQHLAEGRLRMKSGAALPRIL